MQHTLGRVAHLFDELECAGVSDCLRGHTLSVTLGDSSSPVQLAEARSPLKMVEHGILSLKLTEHSYIIIRRDKSRSVCVHGRAHFHHTKNEKIRCLAMLGTPKLQG